MAHTKDTASEVSGLATLMLKHFDFAAQWGRLDGRSARKLSNGSRIDIQTAGAREPPSFGFAFDVALISEFAHVRNAERAWGGVRNAAVAARFLWVESQANGRGGMFYDKWQEAMTEEEFFSTPVRERRACKVFVPYFECEWYQLPVPREQSERHKAMAADRCWGVLHKEGFIVDDEEENLVAKFGLSAEQIAWRRWAIEELCGGNANKFREQYPVDEETAFLSAGAPVFPLDVLDRRRKEVREPVARGAVRDGCFRPGEGDCDVWIWEDPEEQATYTGGADVSQGDADGDSAAVEIVKRKPRAQVAEFVGHRRPAVVAEVCNALGHLYNLAPMGSERDGVNFAMLERLEDDYHYPNIYRHIEQDTTKLGDNIPRVGIKVSARVREILVDRGRACIGEMKTSLPSSRLIDEVCTLAFDSQGRVRHTSTGHDDVFRALCAAVFVAEETEAEEPKESASQAPPVNDNPRAIRPWQPRPDLERHDATLGSNW